MDHLRVVVIDFDENFFEKEYFGYFSLRKKKDDKLL